MFLAIVTAMGSTTANKTEVLAGSRHAFLARFRLPAVNKAKHRQYSTTDVYRLRRPAVSSGVRERQGILQQTLSFDLIDTFDLSRRSLSGRTSICSPTSMSRK